MRQFLEEGTKKLMVSGAIALQAFLSISADSPALDKKEALSLRKITEYWREGNFQNAKTQILDYITAYPDSSYLNELYAMLGDLYFQEKSYADAIATYDKITSPTCKEFTAMRRAESLFLLGKYDDVVRYSETTSASKEDQENRFALIKAEALYRLAIQAELGEKQKKAANEALEAYSLVTDDSTHHVALAIAHLHALSGDNARALAAYLDLAEKMPEKQEELYFRAASQLVETNPQQAMELFQKVIAREGEFLPHAAFNRLTILYKQKNYSQFVAEYDQHSAILKDEQAASLHFCRCIALFHLDRFAESIAPLQALLKMETLTPIQTRQALLSLFFCAQKTNDLELVSTMLPIWSERLPLDEGYLRGLLVKAQIALSQKEAVVASSALKEILERFPNCAERESVLFDYAQSLSLAKTWGEARKTLQQFLEECSASTAAPLAWQHLVYCSMQLLKEASPAEKDALKACLIHDLQAALASNPPLDAEIVRVYRRGTAQLYFELGQHKEALAQAQEYIRAYPVDRDLQSMRLMATACHVMLDSPAESLVAIAEEALLHESDLQAIARLRLQLYNAYLKLSDKDPASLEKAGEHLLAVHQDKTVPIKKENLLWLADFLANKADPAAKNRAIAVLEEALSFDGKELIQPTALDPILLESYSLRLSSLYDQHNAIEKAHALLSSFVKFADANPTISWQQRRHALFSLAQLEEKLGLNENALSVYTRLIDEATYASASYYRRAALLKRAQLQYTALPSEDKKSETTALLTILDTFKELQITKNIHSEPIHLEAALEYASIRSSLAAETEQTGKLLFYLEKMKEDFTSQGDAVALHYHEERGQLPTQNALYNAYMRFIDIEMKRLQSVREKQAGNDQYALLLEGEIKHELQDLLANQALEKTPLAQRVQLSLEKLR